MRNRYWVDTGDHVYVADDEARVLDAEEPEFAEAVVEFAAALVDSTRGHQDPIGWFQDVALAERVCALLNREERLKLYVGPTLRVRVDRARRVPA